MNSLLKTMVRLFLTILLLSLSGSLYSQTMDEAVGDAVSQLKHRGLEEKSRSEIVIEMLNYHSKNFDRQARIIQSVLYTSLQDQFPNVKILLAEEAIVGISAKAILIKGTYKAEGNRTIVELKAIEQMNGRMFAKANARFDSEKEKFENLVAVLPLDAPGLTKSVAKTFSKILRSALNETGVMKKRMLCSRVSLLGNIKLSSTRRTWVPVKQ